MYASYRANEPVRQPTRATVIAGDDFREASVDAHENVRGRVLMYCVAGTFGLLLPAYLQASQATSTWTINQIELAGRREAIQDARTKPAEEIAHIRQVMNMSVSELARVCGVSRQAVHEWIRGGALSLENAQRLSSLAGAADVLLTSGLAIAPQMLRRKVSGGLSVLDAVQGGGNVVELARQLVDTLAREMEQRQRLAARLAGRKKASLSTTEFGAPHLHEDG